MGVGLVYQGAAGRRCEFRLHYEIRQSPSFGTLRETSRSLQRIALGESVGNVTSRAGDGLDASKTMRTGRLRCFGQMASGLHKQGVGRKWNLPPE